MEPTPQIRLGSVLVTFDRRRFVFQDVHDPRMIVTIDDADTSDLIEFIYQASARASEAVKVERVPEKGQP